MFWLLIFLIGLIALLHYGLHIEPQRFRVTEVTLALPRWPAALDGFTILQLADLHTRRPSPVEAFLRRLAHELPEPDLVVLTGDFAENRPAIADCADALSGLRARLGKFAVLGNNDVHSAAATAELAQALAGVGVRLLRDEAVRIGGDGGFELGGLNWVSLKRVGRDYRLPVAAVFAHVPPEVPRVLLAHSPDAIVEASEQSVDLLLCGHTHGGQICLPGGRPLHTNLYRFGPPHYARGRYQELQTVLYVSAGLGMTRPPLRMWCPPEAVLLTLKRG